MPASLSWLDYDSQAHQRAQRIITLFSERETRDELGIGSIRDAIADKLFPGTSVIHTRLRYMFFIPWTYMDLEEQGTSSTRIAAARREAEIYLIECLLENCPDEDGVIGRDAREALKTLPSDIYWAGLGKWGLRLHPGTQGQYHRDIDRIYERRRRRAHRRRDAEEDGDDIGGLWDTAAYTWHPGFPSPPSDFPDNADFRLRRSEAHFLQERLKHACPDSLLADLAAKPTAVSCASPWEHPDLGSFKPYHRQLLVHGHNFSQVHFGAALLYNLLLAEKRGDEERVDEFLEQTREWAEGVEARLSELREWAYNLDNFWSAVSGSGHDIGVRSMTFCEAWFRLALQHRKKVFDNPEARQLIRSREIEKKKANSRFTNQRMLDQWRGRSGLIRMRYRWDLVSTYVEELAVALKGR